MTEMKIGYFPHEHPLFLSWNVDRFDYDCFVCKQPVLDTPYYTCSECKEVVIHKLCGELEKEIQHPFHPLHPLFLRSRPPYRSDQFICKACRKRGSGFVYNCAECEFDLHIQCASLVPTFSYGGHHHLLTLFETNFERKESQRCVCCDTHCYNSFFRCVECNYNIHKSCAADLSKHIQHPFHPPHPLTRINDDPDPFVCNGCLDILYTAYFSCAECSFNLCEKCYLLVPSIKYEGHHHFLTLFLKVNFSIYKTCHSCREKLEDHRFIFRCVECNFNLHSYCHPSFPNTIKHEHDIHPCKKLIFTRSPLKDEEDSNQFSCDACEKERSPIDPFFYCAECDFLAEIGCVIDEILPSLSTENPPQKEIHEHPLFLSSNVDLLYYGCSVCERPVLDTPYYSCSECEEVVIHKLCGELEKEIRHPFHPLHPLILCTRSIYRSDGFICNACRKPGSGFVYHCAQCKFDLHIQCASLVPTFRYGGHHHLLTLFERNFEREESQRFVCCDTDGYYYFFRCVECNFNIHKSCAADDLPKHILHQ